MKYADVLFVLMWILLIVGSYGRGFFFAPDDRLVSMMDKMDMFSALGCFEEETAPAECAQLARDISNFIFPFFIATISGLIDLFASLLAIAMLIWMAVDAIRRSTLSGGKKATWIVLFIFFSAISLSAYFIDIKRKDWDPENVNKKKFIIFAIVSFTLFVIGAGIGLFTAMSL